MRRLCREAVLYMLATYLVLRFGFEAAMQRIDRAAVKLRWKKKSDAG